jgi:methionine biosynthesis protein MetW
LNTQSDDSMEKYYENEYGKRQFVIERKLSSIPDLRITNGAMPKHKRILSVGCGPGYDIDFLVEDNQVEGIDIMHEAVVEAEKRGIRAMVWNAEKGLPYRDEQFDIVVCKEVLEHLIDPNFVLKEIRRVMKKDGYAFLSVPNHFWYWWRLRILLGKGLVLPDFSHWNEWDFFHIRFFTFKGFNQLIRESGLRPVKFYYPETISELLAPGKLRRLNFLFPKGFCTRLAKFKPNLFCAKFFVRVHRSG